MPTLTDSVLDIRQDAPPHDHLLVADERTDLPNVVSDGVQTAKHTDKRIALYYRGAVVVVGPEPSFNSVLSQLKGKLEDPPDYDPEAAAFPDEKHPAARRHTENL